jgi:hypothetical protein
MAKQAAAVSRLRTHRWVQPRPAAAVLLQWQQAAPAAAAAAAGAQPVVQLLQVAQLAF